MPLRTQLSTSLVRFTRRMSADSLTLVMIADVPTDGVLAFRDYESKVLPLLARHAGRLERRLRSTDGETEVHIVSFDSRRGYDSFMADPERAAYRSLLEGAGAITQRLVTVIDV